MKAILHHLRVAAVVAIGLPASLCAHAQSNALTSDEARKIVAPFYDALNQPATKNVDDLLGRATTKD